MSGTITYAPYVEPVSGQYNLVCVSLKWTDNPGPSVDSVDNSCKYAASTFARLSNGQLQYKPAAYTVSVPFTHTAANVPHAVDYAKQQLQTQHGITNDQSTHYIMVNNMAGGPYSYTEPGGNTSNLLNVLSTTFCHELGRQYPTILGSSGAIVDGKMADQADGTTFMGHFSSDSLTASQLYYLGWLKNTQVAQYTGSNATEEFTIDPLEADSTGIKAVLFSQPGQQPLILSRPTFPKHGIQYTLHRATAAQSKNTPSNNRGSVREAVFAEKATFDGFNFVQTGVNGISATISVSPSTAKSISNKVADVLEGVESAVKNVKMR